MLGHGSVADGRSQFGECAEISVLVPAWILSFHRTVILPTNPLTGGQGVGTHRCPNVLRNLCWALVASPRRRGRRTGSRRGWSGRERARARFSKRRLGAERGGDGETSGGVTFGV